VVLFAGLFFRQQKPNNEQNENEQEQRTTALPVPRSFSFRHVCPPAPFLVPGRNKFSLGQSW
jgi:hypothetical protein